MVPEKTKKASQRQASGQLRIFFLGGTGGRKNPKKDQGAKETQLAANSGLSKSEERIHGHFLTMDCGPGDCRRNKLGPFWRGLHIFLARPSPSAIRGSWMCLLLGFRGGGFDHGGWEKGAQIKPYEGLIWTSPSSLPSHRDENDK